MTSFAASMPMSAPLARTQVDAGPAKGAEDRAMLRAAAELTRDLIAPKPGIYWTDLIASVVVGYAAMAGAILAQPLWATLALAAISVLALYRAGSFIHELTHVKHSALKGFRRGWNALVGVPLLVPSFLYEGLHSLHHNRTRYGTVEDPEYLPLALMKPWTVPLFVIASAFAPLALLVRFAIVAPLSALVPPLRRVVVARYSGLVINPLFRRREPEGEFRLMWHRQEIACAVWALALVAIGALGLISLRDGLIIAAIVSSTLVLNQVRTLVAHLWENEGEVLSVTEQFLDSVNVPPPGTLPELWAPVGLRYHALHHLLPTLPYHSLPEAHRRLTQALPGTSRYHDANYDGLFGLVRGLVGASAGRR